MACPLAALMSAACPADAMNPSAPTAEIGGMCQQAERAIGSGGELRIVVVHGVPACGVDERRMSCGCHEPIRAHRRDRWDVSASRTCDREWWRAAYRRSPWRARLRR